MSSTTQADDPYAALFPVYTTQVDPEEYVRQHGEDVLTGTQGRSQEGVAALFAWCERWWAEHTGR